MSQGNETGCKAQIRFKGSVIPVDFQGEIDALYKAVEETCKDLYKANGFSSEIFIEITKKNYDSPPLPGDMKGRISQIPSTIDKNLGIRTHVDIDGRKVFSLKYKDTSREYIQNQIELFC